MADSTLLAAIERQVHQLSHDEQLRLIERLDLSSVRQWRERVIAGGV